MGTERTLRDLFPWKPMCFHGNLEKLVFGGVVGLIDPNMGARVRNEGEKTQTTVAMETCCHIATTK